MAEAAVGRPAWIASRTPSTTSGRAPHSRAGKQLHRSIGLFLVQGCMGHSSFHRWRFRASVMAWYAPGVGRCRPAVAVRTAEVALAQPRPPRNGCGEEPEAAWPRGASCLYPLTGSQREDSPAAEQQVDHPARAWTVGTWAGGRRRRGAGRHRPRRRRTAGISSAPPARVLVGFVTPAAVRPFKMRGRPTPALYRWREASAGGGDQEDGAITILQGFLPTDYPDRVAASARGTDLRAWAQV